MDLLLPCSSSCGVSLCGGCPHGLDQPHSRERTRLASRGASCRHLRVLKTTVIQRGSLRHGPRRLAPGWVGSVNHSLQHLSDGALLQHFSTLVYRDRSTAPELLPYLAVINAHKMHLPAANTKMNLHPADEAH